MSKSMLVAKDASAWLGRLADEGWCGAPGNAARGKLALYLSAYKTKRRILCVPRTGWMQGAFVFPDVTIKKAADRAGHAGQAAGGKALNSSGTKPGSHHGVHGRRGERLLRLSPGCPFLVRRRMGYYLSHDGYQHVQRHEQRARGRQCGAKSIARSPQNLLLWGTKGMAALCGTYPLPVWLKSQYKLQPVRPVRSALCPTIGRGRS